MELKDFIKQVLADITNAVAESQQELKNGCIIAPRFSDCESSDIVLYKKGWKAKAYEVEFDISLTTEDTGNAKGKIGVLSSIVGIGAEAASQNTNTQTNRVKFTVPVIYNPLGVAGATYTS